MPCKSRYVGDSVPSSKLNAGVLDAFGHERIRFEFPVVAGRDHAGVMGAQVVQKRPRQRRPFAGVGARADFVQQHQRIAAQVAQNTDNVCDMARKRGQRLLQALLVADVRKHLVEDIHLGPRRWHMQAALGHQCQQPGRLETHGFAAGVRSRNQKNFIRARAQLNVNRHHGFGVN